MAKWHAVVMDREDTDWGTGSFDFGEAAEIYNRRDRA